MTIDFGDEWLYDELMTRILGEKPSRELQSYPSWRSKAKVNQMALELDVEQAKAEDQLDVKKVKAGDQEELFRLFKLLVPHLYDFAEQIAPDDAHGVVEEAILRIFGNLQIFKGANNPEQLLKRCRRITQNISIERARKTPLFAFEEPPRVKPPHSPEPSDTSETVPQLIKDALVQLSSAERLLIEWRSQGMTLSEIAEKLGISQYSLGLRLHRAISKLRKLLGAEE